MLKSLKFSPRSEASNIDLINKRRVVQRDSESIASNETHPLVSIIILNFNGLDYLLPCLSSVFKTEYPNFEVLVVDNGSSDRSIEETRKRFRRVKIIANKTNLGYATGNNIGIKHALGEYIVLLNNDTIVSPTWLTCLVDEAIKRGNAILQPKILLALNRRLINTVGNRIHLLGFGLPTGAGEIDKGQYDTSREIGYASGVCLFAPKTVFDDVGLLDDAHFLQCEDIDWGWRAKIFGYSSYLVPQSKIYHWWSRSLTWSAQKFYWLERNRLFTILKNYDSRTLILILPMMVAAEMAILPYAICKGFIKLKIRSYAELFMLRKYIATMRMKIEKKRKVSDSVLIHKFERRIDHPYLPQFLNVASRFIELYSKVIFGE